MYTHIYIYVYIYRNAIRTCQKNLRASQKSPSLTSRLPSLCGTKQHTIASSPLVLQVSHNHLQKRTTTKRWPHSDTFQELEAETIETVGIRI